MVKNLFDILAREDAQIIGWTTDGLAFEVRDLEGMAKQILPKYFRHAKYASFQRQLNYFGFRKINKASTCPNVSTYCQPNFVRHNPDAMALIKRKTHSAKSRKWRVQKPNFQTSNPTADLYPTTGLDAIEPLPFVSYSFLVPPPPPLVKSISLPSTSSSSLSKTTEEFLYSQGHFSTTDNYLGLLF